MKKNRRRVPELVHSLNKTYLVFGKHARAQMLKLAFLMAGGAFLEAIGAALIVPFVAIINDPDYIFSNEYLNRLYIASGQKSSTGFIVSLAVGLLFFFLAKNLYLVAMANLQFRFVYGEMPAFSAKLFDRYMQQPILSHISKNSAEMIRNVTNEVFMFFTNFVIPAMTLITEVLVLIAILITLLLFAPIPTLLAISVLGMLTGLFYRTIRRRIRHFGELQQSHNTERIKWVKQAFGSLKEAKVLARESYFISKFNSHDVAFSESARYAMMLSQTPRLFIETIAFAALFLGVAVGLSLGLNPAEVLPILALFGVAAVRLLPSLNRILLSVTRMNFYQPSANVVFEACRMGDHLRIPNISDGANISRNWKSLELDNLTFSYPNGKNVFAKLSMKIPRGSSVALVGPSGIGKTTLGDVLLGLLEPQAGRVLIDGVEIFPAHNRSWKKHLGYIPQSVFLLDDSVRRNVAFGVSDSDIDDERVWSALRSAQLEQHIRSFPEGLSAGIGENGSTLSGGQKQRLNIARALYNEPDFLVLDEATSALDEATEREIAEMMDSLRGRVTLIVIAHREETIRRCQTIYSMEMKKNL